MSTAAPKPTAPSPSSDIAPQEVLPSSTSTVAARRLPEFVAHYICVFANVAVSKGSLRLIDHHVPTRRLYIQRTRALVDTILQHPFNPWGGGLFERRPLFERIPLFESAMIDRAYLWTCEWKVPMARLSVLVSLLPVIYPLASAFVVYICCDPNTLSPRRHMHVTPTTFVSGLRDPLVCRYASRAHLTTVLRDLTHIHAVDYIVLHSVRESPACIHAVCALLMASV